MSRLGEGCPGRLGARPSVACSTGSTVIFGRIAFVLSSFLSGWLETSSRATARATTGPYKWLSCRRRNEDAPAYPLVIVRHRVHPAVARGARKIPEPQVHRREDEHPPQGRISRAGLRTTAPRCRYRLLTLPKWPTACAFRRRLRGGKCPERRPFAGRRRRMIHTRRACGEGGSRCTTPAENAHRLPDVTGSGPGRVFQ